MRTVQEQYLPLLGGTVELIIKCYAAVYYAKLLDSAAQVSMGFIIVTLRGYTVLRHTLRT